MPLVRVQGERKAMAGSFARLIYGRCANIRNKMGCCCVYVIGIAGELIMGCGKEGKLFLIV